MNDNKKVALITGITGQDGSYLAEFLLEKGYEVHGLVRRVALESDSARFSRINHLLKNSGLILHSGDITDYSTVWRLIEQAKPDEIYHLAAIANIPESFKDEFGTFTTNISGTHYFLFALKDIIPQSRFYFAATSDLFSGIGDSPQDEQARFAPTTPYGVSKASGFYLTKFYRDVHHLFACSGIAFSHESPRRGFDFVTRKITSAVARIKAGKEKELRLGNLDARRDWGFAGDYIEAMWLMLQAERPDDYVIGTGESHTIREFVETAFKFVGLNWEDYVVIDKSLFRLGEAREWLANPKKIECELHWKAKTHFQDLVEMMVESDIKNT